MKILDFPELRQTYEYDCGASALQSILAYYGIEISEETIINAAKTEQIIGTSIKGIKETLNKYNLKFKYGSMLPSDLKKFIDRKIPILVLLQAWNGKETDYSKDYSDGHWVVAIGYDKDEFIFEDPYSFKRTFLKKKELISRWHGKEKTKILRNLGIAVYGKKPVFCSEEIVHMD